MNLNTTLSTSRPPLTNKQKFLQKLERFDNETLAVKQNPFYTEILGPNLQSAVQHVDTLHTLQYLASKAKVGCYFVPPVSSVTHCSAAWPSPWTTSPPAPWAAPPCGSGAAGWTTGSAPPTQ